MTTVIILDWLTWFNKKISSKKVLLLIDGFSAYKAAIQTTFKNGFFKNMCVEFLPLNYTFVY